MFKKPGFAISIFSKSLMSALIKSFNFIANLFGFNLFVYVANLWIIFKEDNLYDMVLNCVAMEFLMNLDNEFEEMYFKYLPESADDIYDNVFVSYTINQEKIQEKKKSKCFRCISISAYIPFKLLTISLMLFPVLCLIMMIYSPLCK